MYTNIVFKSQVKNNKEAFIYEERHSIEKILFSEVSSFSSLRSPADRWGQTSVLTLDLRTKLIKVKLLEAVLKGVYVGCFKAIDNNLYLLELFTRGNV